MNRKPLNVDDVRMLNEQVLSRNMDFSSSARRTLLECVNHPECFADAIAEDWVKRIVNRINHLSWAPRRASRS